MSWDLRTLLRPLGVVARYELLSLGIAGGSGAGNQIEPTRPLRGVRAVGDIPRGSLLGVVPAASQLSLHTIMNGGAGVQRASCKPLYDAARVASQSMLKSGSGGTSSDTHAATGTLAFDAASATRFSALFTREMLLLAAALGHWKMQQTATSTSVFGRVWDGYLNSLPRRIPDTRQLVDNLPEVFGDSFVKSFAAVHEACRLIHCHTGVPLNDVLWGHHIARSRVVLRNPPLDDDSYIRPVGDDGPKIDGTRRRRYNKDHIDTPSLVRLDNTTPIIVPFADLFNHSGLPNTHFAPVQDHHRNVLANSGLGLSGACLDAVSLQHAIAVIAVDDVAAGDELTMDYKLYHSRGGLLPEGAHEGDWLLMYGFQRSEQDLRVEEQEMWAATLGERVAKLTDRRRKGARGEFVSGVPEGIKALREQRAKVAAKYGRPVHPIPHEEQRRLEQTEGERQSVLRRLGRESPQPTTATP